MEKDLTTGHEGLRIFFFALPMMGASLLQALYTFVDSVIVGNFVSSTALGAVGISSPLMWFLLAMATGTGTGTSIIISQYYGARKETDMRRTASTGIIFAVVLSLILTLVCIITGKWVLWNFLGTPQVMQELSYTYFAVYSVGLIFQFLYNVLYGILRACGDSKGAILFLFIAAVLNLTLDLLFVVVFDWGVAGAAWATVIAQGGSAISSAIYLYMAIPKMRFKLREFTFDGEKLRLIMRLGIPVTMQSAVMAAGFILLQRLVNSFGPASIEGFVAMNKTEQIAHIPSTAFHAAMANFVGQNMGAGKITRIKRGYRVTLWMANSICLVLTVFLLVFDTTLLSLFNITGDAMLRAREHLNVVALFLVIGATSHVTNGLLQGAGDVKIPAVASFANLSIRLLLSYFMAATFIDFRAIYLSLPLAWIVGCLISLMRYGRGHWRTKAIVSS
ncbi:MAG: MATE family efflux transporter [Dehalobacterium sp.]|jgi:putative MATE family efflux protein